MVTWPGTISVNAHGCALAIEYPGWPRTEIDCILILGQDLRCGIEDHEILWSSGWLLHDIEFTTG